MTCEVDDCTIEIDDSTQTPSTASNGFPVTVAVMSDGQSITEISECGSDQVVPIDSSSDTNSVVDSRIDSSDCESDEVDSASSGDSCSVDLDETKTPAGERIAKDTGCCLYSAITALVIMLVVLGIVLMVNGPVLGLSIPSLVRVNTPLPPLDHNYLVTNGSLPSENQLDHENYDYLDYHYFNSSSQSPVEFEDYHEDSEREHDELEKQQESTTNIPLNAVNETTEDLASLSPEALRLNPKYVAYVPIPIKDEDDIEDGEEHFFEEETVVLDRDDEEEIDHYDEVYQEDNVTPRSSSNLRRRPEAIVDKLILPILMVPAESSAGERRKTGQASDSWGSNDFSDQRRFDDDDGIGEASPEDHLKPSPSLRIPGLQRLRNRAGNKGTRVRNRDDGIDYRMFGSLAPESRRPQRPRLPLRGRQQDDYARTTSLYQDRIPPFRPKNPRGRVVEQRNGPSIYIRPPPRPRSRNQQQRFRSSTPWSPNEVTSRQRTIASATRKPPYSYPKDAMSIQDIISYMTSLSHSSESSTTNPIPVERKNVWNTDSTYQASRPLYDSSWPNVLPPPTRMTADSRADSTVHLGRNGVTANPYSFKLDVYPIRDGVTTVRTNKQTGNSLRYSPTSSQSYRQSQDYRTQYYSRQPSTASDTSGTLAGIDYSYQVHIPEENKNSDPYRRPYDPGYRDVMPVPASYRPRQPTREESVTTKPKLVVHLNVFNQRDQENTYNNRFGDDRRDEEGDYYSPSDIYRAVLKNNMANNRQDVNADDDDREDGLMGGQSRLKGYSQHSDGPSAGGQDKLYENHNMASTDNYYRSQRRQSGSANYRRNIYPNDEVPEMLPIPMAVTAPDTSPNSTPMSTAEETPSSR